MAYCKKCRTEISNEQALHFNNMCPECYKKWRLSSTTLFILICLSLGGLILGIMVFLEWSQKLFILNPLMFLPYGLIFCSIGTFINCIRLFIINVKESIREKRIVKKKSRWKKKLK